MKQEVIDQITELVLKTNFATLFAFPGLFKAQAALFELKPDKFAKWVDNLKLPIVDNVLINTVNSMTDKAELYTKDDFTKWGYGLLASRSIAIPGFLNAGVYLDGGVAANPCLDPFFGNELPIFVSQLMQSYQTTPNSRLEKLSYAWDYRSFQDYQTDKTRFGNRLKTLYPFVTDISSIDFGISADKKKAMIKKGYAESITQFEFYGIEKSPEPIEINLGLSGGGIRSFAHIGVIQALMEYNYHPKLYSATSGGSIVAILFAGYEAKLA